MEGFKIFVLTVAVSVQVTSQDSTTEPPVQISKPKITLNLAHEVLYNTETVILRCEVSGEPPGLQYDWYKDSKDLDEHQPSITANDTGKYECKAKKGATESGKSDSYTLTLKDPPKAKLTVDPDWTEVFPGENISLQCSIQNVSENWNYIWFKNSSKIDSSGETNIKGNTLTLSVQSSHDGAYVCQAELQDRNVTTAKSTLYSLTVIDYTPNPEIRKHQWFEPFYTDERVQLHCNMSGVGWEYHWNKDSNPLITNPELTIDSVSVTDTGDYHCKAQRGDFSVDSETLQVRVQEPPKPQIQSDWTEAFTGEKVSLQCLIKNVSGNWNYMWFKGQDKIVSSSEANIKGNTLTLSVQSGHGGAYVCQAELQDRNVTTAKSTPHSLTVKELPQPKLSIESQWNIFYLSEKVTLKCSIDEDSNKWGYEWFINGAQPPKNTDMSLSGNTLSISSAKSSHSGQYTCRGRHLTRKPVTTGQTEAVQLHIQDYTPKPEIRKHQWFELFYTDERVQLHCNMSGVGWEYHWNKDSNPLITNPELTIDSVSVTDTGDYHCKAQRGDFSVDSETLQVRVQEPPKPQIQSDWTEAFTGEKVSLQCLIKNVSGNWNYMWFKGQDKIVSSSEANISGNTLTLSVQSGHGGAYVCQAELQDRNVTTAKSTPHSLTVKELPQPKLSIESQWNIFYLSEKVTLKCSIDEDSNKWGYEWFINGAQPPKNTDMSLSGNTLSISSAKSSHSGQYTCRGRHLTRTPVTTGQTEAVQLHIQDYTPKPEIRKHQWFEPFYTDERVQLHCNMSGVGWEYHWNKDSNPLITNPELTIDSVSVTDTGDYHCKAQRGDFSVDSETLQVRVQEPHKPQIQSDWTEAFTGEKVSLQCLIKNVSGNWNYMWFKGQDKIVSSSEANIKGNTLTLSVQSGHGGAYVCQAELQDRNVTTAKSTAHSLTVKELPQPKLSIESQWNIFYLSEKVTLKCSIDEDSNKWGYEWFINGAQPPKNTDMSLSGNTLSISSAKSSHSGQYTCRGRHLTRTPVTTGQTEAVQLHIQDYTPKPEIRKHQWFEPFYTDERVQLHCNMSGVGWEYHWNKDSNPLITNPELTIDSVSVTDTGDYHCKAQRGDFSVDSETLQVRVQEPPKPQIQSDWTEAFTGEKVSLQCLIKNVSGNWNYMWFKGQDKIVSSSEANIKGNTLTLSVQSGHGGAYVCQAELQDRNVTTAKSALHSLTVHEPPKPQIQSDWTEAFHGEKVSLQCVIQDSNNWNYMWFKGQDKIVSSSEANIKGNALTLSVQSGHGGAYVCQAELQDRKVTTAKSAPHSLTVHELPQPKLSIESQWNIFYLTEKVTLKCSIDEDSNKWGYEWFINGAQPPKNTDMSLSGNTLSISSAKSSHSGQYTCRGRHLTRTPVTTGQTEAVQLHIQDNTPKPTITKHEWFELFYTDERVQINCNMPGVGWEYHWYKDSNPLITNPELTIDSVSVTDTGDYHCKAQRGDFSVDSETLQVRVQEPHKPQIQSDWTEAFTGEKVSLQCVIQDSNNWNYMWFKGQDKIVSSSEANIKGNALTLSVQSGHGGAYVCQAELQDRKVTTAKSAPHSLTVHEPPKPQIQSDWTEAFHGEKVSLQCVIQDSNNWNYMWFKGQDKIVSSSEANIKGNALTLSVQSGHGGAYVCQAELQDRKVTTAKSAPHSLTVHGSQPTILLQQDPSYPEIYTEEQVKLVCKIEENTSKWQYILKKDSQQVNTDHNPVYTIQNATLSQKGEYTCEVRRGEMTSAKSTNLTIRVPPKPELSITPRWKTFYKTEKLTLKCSVNEDSNKWGYEWFRNGARLFKNKDISLSGNTLSISSAKAGHSGQYTCRGRHLTRKPVTTRQAETVQLHVNDNTPNPTITKHEWFELFYTEERVQLHCNMPGVGWEYHWNKDSNPLITNPELTIDSVSDTDTGDYHCKAQRGDFSVDSETLQVRVQGISLISTCIDDTGDVLKDPLQILRA
ncbi:hemicentin-1-like isoform X2 [Onychostoma macrolepis]|uniref:hemicentin-1-like isoform X2 n=1 Tax=Onychostoma macrolepis TaxID=369639 RepID=UPI00272CF48F|nr:hemicentin-1-like isoform X2 [Onychostoma macrolepis]XP_058618662.1 hemicentin-1-like isoform X2 [Onychostoma macrolepis]